MVLIVVWKTWNTFLSLIALSSSLAKTGETLCKIAISQQPRGVVRTHFVGLLIVAIPPVDISGVLSDEEVVVS